MSRIFFSFLFVPFASPQRHSAGTLPSYPLGLCDAPSCSPVGGKRGNRVGQTTHPVPRTPSNKITLNKDLLKKASQHQAATPPSLRRQQQHLHHRPHCGLDLVWRSVSAAGLLGVRPPFLSHAHCNDGVRRGVVGVVLGLCSTWHSSTQSSKCPSFIHQGMTMRSKKNAMSAMTAPHSDSTSSRQGHGCWM